MITDAVLPDAEVVYRSGAAFPEQPIETCPDGMPRVTAPLAAPETVLLRPKSLASFATALYWIDALGHRGHAVPSLVLPFIPGARQDRVNCCGDVLFTLKSVARDLNARCIPTVVVLDPHSDVASALIDRCEVAGSLFPFPNRDDGVLAPDGGAEKRVARVAASMSVPLCHAWKTRSVRTGQLDGFGGEPIPPGHHPMADDICDGGATIIGLVQLFTLRRRGSTLSNEDTRTMITDDSLLVSPRAFLAAATALVGAGALLAVEASALVSSSPLDDERSLSTDAEWDAAFVQHVGYWAHSDHARGPSTWPLPHADSARELADIARVLGMMRPEPGPADIFTTWSQARREFVRTGIIVAVTGRRVESDGAAYYECVTLEGNVNARSDARGALVRCVRRCLSADSGDRFIRWVEAMARGAVSAAAMAPAPHRLAA